MESRLEKIFSMGINSMSLAVWLGEDRKCSAAVVGLDLLLGLSMVRRCSLNRSFKRRFVSPMYCKLQIDTSQSNVFPVASVSSERKASESRELCFRWTDFRFSLTTQAK